MGLRRTVRRRGDGTVRVTIGATERDVLADLAASLRPLVDVDPNVPLDDLRARLFPRAYEDPIDDQQYAELNFEPLAEAKRTALDTFAESLAAAEPAGRSVHIDLDGEQQSAWLAVINDARLVLGKICDIRSEADWEAVRASDDDAARLLDYLSFLQEELLQALMHALEED